MATNDLWKTTLQRIRKEFATLDADGLRLICVLRYSQEPADQPCTGLPHLSLIAGANLRMSEPGAQCNPDFFGDGDLIPDGAVSQVCDVRGELMDTPDGQPIPVRRGFARLHFLYANDLWDHRIKERLEEAGRCVQSLPASLRQFIWSDWADRKIWFPDAAGIWLDAVFELAWKDIPGSALQGERWAWNGEHNYRVTMARDGRIPDCSKDFPELARQVEVLGNPPIHWYSVIENFCLTSVAAIDVLEYVGTQLENCDHEPSSFDDRMHSRDGSSTSNGKSQMRPQSPSGSESVSGAINQMNEYELPNDRLYNALSAVIHRLGQASYDNRYVNTKTKEVLLKKDWDYIDGMNCKTINELAGKAGLPKGGRIYRIETISNDCAELNIAYPTDEMSDIRWRKDKGTFVLDYDDYRRLETIRYLKKWRSLRRAQLIARLPKLRRDVPRSFHRPNIPATRQEWLASLHHLIAALKEYSEAEASSDPRDPPEPIDPGHAVHAAVVMVQSHYSGGKLPDPARVAWMDLLQVTRGERETVRPNQEALDAEYSLRQWAEAEIEGMTQTDGDQSKILTDDRPAVRRPSDNAIAAWRLRDIKGLKTQNEIADRLTNELGRPISQGQVSRWLKDVENYLAAGNVLPNPTPSSRARPIDPSAINEGRRRDGRTPRQRHRRDPDSDE